MNDEETPWFWGTFCDGKIAWTEQNARVTEQCANLCSMFPSTPQVLMEVNIVSQSGWWRIQRISNCLQILEQSASRICLGFKFKKKNAFTLNVCVCAPTCWLCVYVCIHVHTEVRGQPWLSFSSVSTLFLETVSHFHPVLAHDTHLKVFSGDWTRVLTLTCWTLTS